MIAEFDRAIAAGHRRPIIVAPTASGKTVIFSAIIKAAQAQGKRAIVLAHTREIIRQTSEKLSANDIEHGVIMAGFMTQPDAMVQVAGIQTLWSRAVRSNRMELPPADLLIVDEAHHCPARTYRKIIDSLSRRHPDRAYRDAVPWRRPRARQHLRCHRRMSAGR